MSDRERERPGYEQEEQPEKVGGAIGGATLGAAGGGLAIGTLGPLGTVLGLLASTAGGWWAGREFVRAVRELEEKDGRLRELHGGADIPVAWQETRHAYQLGYLAGRNPGYGEGEFEAVEEDLRAAWVRAHEEQDTPTLPWDEVREQVRLGWGIGRESC